MTAVAIADNAADLDWPRHAVATSDRAALATILLPEVTLTIWQRAIDRQPIDRLLLDDLADVSLTCSSTVAAAPVRVELAAAGYPVVSVTPLARDIAALAAMLGDLLDKDDVQIRLEIIADDACRKFHADYVSIRLITTYAGPGTQWLDQHDAARVTAGAALDDLTIREISTSHVALFKGREWNADKPIVHRSPPIMGSGAKRLVLVIDPADRANQPDPARS